MNKILVSLLLTLGITGMAHAAGDAEAGQGKVAVCGACHGADGNSPAPNFPKLAGQGERYLLKQLQDIKAGSTPGAPEGVGRKVLEMTGMLDPLSDQDLQDIAAAAVARDHERQPGDVGSPAAEAGRGLKVNASDFDIRDGLQIECIGCAACIDACDAIMDKMNYPRGLISYTTEHNLSGQKTHLLRPRLIGYAVALLAMMGLFTYAVYDRPLVKLDVLKDRVLYRENEQGNIENVYTLKVMNKAQREQTFVIEASGLDGLVYEGRSEIRAEAGELVTVPVELSIAPEKLPSSTNEIVFHVRSVDDESINDDADSRFIGPSIR